MRELQTHQPEIYQLADTSYTDTLTQFEEMPDISIDYAVADKSQHVVTFLYPLIGMILVHGMPFMMYWIKMKLAMR